SPRAPIARRFASPTALAMTGMQARVSAHAGIGEALADERCVRVSVVLASACLGAPAPAELDISASHVEVKDIPVGTPIALDVLVVLDNSRAMKPYDARVRTGLDETFEYLDGPGLDLQVGVVTTDSAQSRGVLTSVLGPDG